MAILSFTYAMIFEKQEQTKKIITKNGEHFFVSTCRAILGILGFMFVNHFAVIIPISNFWFRMTNFAHNSIWSNFLLLIGLIFGVIFYVKYILRLFVLV